MNKYDKYINDDLLSKVFKNRLEEEDKKELFDITYNPKTVYVTCASTETKFNNEEFEKFLKTLNKGIEERRRLILEFFLNEYVGKTEEVKKPVFSIYSSTLC